MKLLIVLMAAISLASCSSKSLVIKNVANEQTCNTSDGYWYNGQCWTEFEDEGISNNDIDNVVAEQMKIIKKTRIKINEKSYPITFFYPEEDGKKLVVIVVFDDEQGQSSLIMEMKAKQLELKSFDVGAVYFSANVLELDDDADIEQVIKGVGSLKAVVYDADEIDLSFSGKMTSQDGQKSYDLDLRLNEAISGAGTSKFAIKGDEATLNGDLGTITYHQLKDIILNHPEVKTIVMGHISGSLNDAVNMHTGRILHEAGLNTKVLSDSDIASGGVDLFCAGIERIVEKGAKIGIHSWCCLNDLTAAEIPKEHPAHKYQIEYFTMCLGEQQGPKFYFHTLEAAPFDGVHWMSDEAIKSWKIATRFID